MNEAEIKQAIKEKYKKTYDNVIFTLVNRIERQKDNKYLKIPQAVFFKACLSANEKTGSMLDFIVNLCDNLQEQGYVEYE